MNDSFSRKQPLLRNGLKVNLHQLFDEFDSAAEDCVRIQKASIDTTDILQRPSSRVLSRYDTIESILLNDACPQS